MKLAITFFLICIHISFINAQDIECPKPQIIGVFEQNGYQIIYPFGWSESGNFAYILQDLNLNESSDYVFKAVIQNMKSDSVLWYKDIVFSADDNPDIHWDCECDYTIDGDVDYMKKYNHSFLEKVIWPKHKNEIITAIEDFNIKVDPQSLLKLSDLAKSKIMIEEIKSKYEDYCIEKYEIVLKENNKVKKVVYSYHTPKDQNLCGKNSSGIWYRDFSVEGYFKSPFDDQIAIVVFEKTNGYEETFEKPFLVGTNFL